MKNNFGIQKKSFRCSKKERGHSFGTSKKGKMDKENGMEGVLF